MSIRQGKKLIASSTTNGFNLFDCKWADHILNNISWLRADTFSWQSGDVYVAAYQHLVNEFKGGAYISVVGDGKLYRTPSDDVVISGTQYYAWSNYAAFYLTTSGTPQKGDMVYNRDGTDTGAYINSVGVGIISPQTDTIGNITITYALSEDGHKICLPDQESNLVALYEQTGVAWYYILDTTNRQFKLPRTKWGFTGLRDSVGGYVAPGLPNITGSVTRNLYSDAPTATGSFVKGSTSNTNLRNDGKGEPAGTLSFDASRSSSVYGNSDTVQPPATQMYLYFYVGNFEQSAIEQTAGLNAEMFNDLNAHKVIEFQAPTSANGYTWYRKYADGWVEQGGVLGSLNNSRITITLPVEMANTKYITLAAGINASTASDFAVAVINPTTTSVTIGTNANYGAGSIWYVCGMAA